VSQKFRFVTPIESRAQSASSSGALTTGLAGTDWELDFTPCSFHHIMQVLRVCSFSPFALPPALPPCCCPLAFPHQVRRLASRMSSESYPGSPECVVSCHGAERFANNIPGLNEAREKVVSGRAAGVLLCKALWKLQVFLLTRDPLRRRMHLAHTNYPSLQPITEPMLTEPHAQRRHGQRTAS
jgi:hypothetical protein